MKLFPPGPLRIGDVVVAKLHRVVRRNDGGFIAQYRLEPIDLVEYGARVGGLRGSLGRRYAPLPGTWSSFVVPEDRDDVELWIGLEPGWGAQMREASVALKIDPPSVVSEGTLRALALGYLSRAGV